MVDKEALESAIEKQALFAEEFSFEAMDPEVIDRAKLILLDSIGCMAAGNIQYEEAFLEDGDFRLIGRRKTSKELSVIFNGASMVKNELDEGNQFAFGHPACHIVPALLAETQSLNAAGNKMLEALVTAYEISCRWGCSARAKAQMHVHGTMQTVGAAIAACKLNSLSREEICRAILLANSLPQATTWVSALNGDQLRNAYIGLSNLVGMNAFRMTKAKIESSIASLISVWQEVLDGDIDAEGLTKDIGVDFYISKNYFKVHSGCRYTHGFVDMLQELLDEGLRKDDIARIEVETYHAAAKLSGQDAPNGFAARFSIPVAIAIYLIYGAISIETLTDENAVNKEVKELAHRVFVTENEEFNRQLPEIRHNKITVYTKNGTALVKDTTVTRGDYLDPFSKADVIQKFENITRNVFGKERQTEIEEYIFDLENKESVQPLFDLLGPEL